MATSEAASRISNTRFDDLEYKRKKRALAIKLGWANPPFPEVEIEDNQPLIFEMIEPMVREMIADVAAIAEVDTTAANAIISRSLAKIHFADQDKK